VQGFRVVLGSEPVKFPSVEPSIAAAAVELSTQAGRFRDVVPVIRKLLMREDPETVAEELPKWQVLIETTWAR